MTTIKVSHPTSVRSPDISQFIGNTSGQLGGYHFVVNDDVADPDFWFIIEATRPDDSRCFVPPNRVCYLAAETSTPIGYWNRSPNRRDYLSQFAHVWTFNDILFRDAVVAPPFCAWMINVNQGDPNLFSSEVRDAQWLRKQTHVPKTRTLSVICSSKTFTREHELRLAFVTAAKERFRDKLDWFGNGIQPIPTKWEGLAPYRFTLAIENRYWPNIFTEKLLDPFLSLTVPIYFGAPNASDYFPSEAMLPINIGDPREALNAIEKIIDEDPYEHHVDALRDAKDRVLNDFNIFTRIARIADGIASTERALPRREVSLRPLWPKDFLAGRAELTKLRLMSAADYLDRRF